MTEYTIKHKRGAHLFITLLVVLLMAVTNWAIFFKEDRMPLNGTAYIISGVVTVIGCLVLFFAIRILSSGSNVIYINDKGFEYNPGGVSSGFIEWAQVEAVKKIPVVASDASIAVMARELTLAIKLKDPASYRLSKNTLLKPLLNFNSRKYDADIFIRLSSLGKELQEVEALFEKYGNNGRPLTPMM